MAKQCYDNLPPYLKEQCIKIDEEFEKSQKLPKGLVIGKLFQIPVADGKAVYQVETINKRTVKVKWRKDLSLDGYSDLMLGSGGTVPKVTIESLIKREEVLAELFSPKK